MRKNGGGDQSLCGCRNKSERLQVSFPGRPGLYRVPCLYEHEVTERKLLWHLLYSATKDIIDIVILMRVPLKTHLDRRDPVMVSVCCFYWRIS